MLARDRHALYAYWWPADLQKDFPIRQVSISVPDRPEGELSAPVLVDPLTAQVHKIAAVGVANGRWRIDSIPLADYPLVVTDRAVVRAT